MAVSEANWNHSKEKPFLFVGMVYTDLVLTCPEYPVEDSIIRAEGYVKRRGGNASNSCTALGELGVRSELLTAFGGDENSEFLKRDLEEHNIPIHHCPTHFNYKSRLCFLLNSLATGSRSGVIFDEHSTNVSHADFCKIDLSKYSWIHFEGVCVTETIKMMASVDEWNSKQSNKNVPYSVELELCNEETEKLIPLADYLIVGKDFAQYRGYKDMLSTINGISAETKPGAVIIVPWGDQGAMARCSNGDIVSSAAFSPSKVVDSIAAGDTFIAATVLYLARQKSVAEAITFGCKVAGAKVGIYGFKGLGESVHNLYHAIQ